ncbi:MAG: hypothetical protein HFE62_04495 [Firmicutes bacterium]|nr:hypothetical protein [Bacillota bacterium]
MYWEKVKKIFIYLLIFLNIALFTANFLSGSKHKITTAREAAIYKVLEQNNVGLYTEIIDSFAPMRSLSISITPPEIDEFRNIFFKNENPTITREFDKTILVSGTKSLIVEDDTITYSNPEGTGKIENFDRTTAMAAADEFLKLLNINNSNISLENIIPEDNAFIFEYAEKFHGYKIFSGIKRIEVSSNGIISASAGYYTAQEFTGERRGIYACDEILLTFLEEIKNEHPGKSVYIEKLELGYDFGHTNDVADGSNLRLVPCYRIFISGSSKAYTINAYTNELKDTNTVQGG